jgi:phage tail sheath gpL-like
MSGSQTTPQNIIFNEIPTGILVPGEYTEVRPYYGNVGVLGYPTRVLLFGQVRPLLATANYGQVYTITSASQAVALGGAGSPAAAAAAAYLLANPLAQLDVIFLAAPSTGGLATGTFTISGAPTAPGTFSASVAGVNYRIGVSLTDTPTSIAANLRAAMAADPNLPATVSAALGVLTVNAGFKGQLGNDIDLRCNAAVGDTFPPGITCAVVDMSGGTLFPDITAAISTAATTWYTDIIMPFYDTANLALLAADLDRRYTALGKQDCMSWTCYSNSYGSAQTFATGQNDKHMCFLPVYNSQTPTYAMTGALAGVASFALANDPSRQLRGLTLPGVVGPADVDAFIESQRQQLLLVGQSTTTSENGVMAIERLVTANTTTSLGVADASWRDVMTARTLSRIRYDWNTYRALLYPQAKLAPDGSLAAQSDVQGTVTPMRAKGSWAGRCRLYEQLGWIVNGQAAAQASIFQINASDPNRLDQQLVVNITGNLMVDATVLEFQVGA